MVQNTHLNEVEKSRLITLKEELRHLTKGELNDDDFKKIEEYHFKAMQADVIQRDAFGLHPLLEAYETSIIVATEIGITRGAILGVLLNGSVICGLLTTKEVEREFGMDVAIIVHGLARINELYEKNPVVESENFRQLILSFAEDMRVILIVIASRVCLMRKIKESENDVARRHVASEAAYLYAPLAHKLGLYKLKSELEDLSLKYLEHDAYYHIKEKLNATKKSRDAYIERFITPIEKKLKEAGLKFHMKGRTKSIHSIWQKMKKQRCPFDGVYDLFAIRIILDSPLEREKQDCWQVFSIITDMYQPNPKRMRDNIERNHVLDIPHADSSSNSRSQGNTFINAKVHAFAGIEGILNDIDKCRSAHVRPNNYHRVDLFQFCLNQAPPAALCNLP